MGLVQEAIEQVLLGATIRDLHEEQLLRQLDVGDERDLQRALRALTNERRREIRENARRFTGEVCRLLGEQHANDDRIRRVLEAWVGECKDYDAFDALLSNFDFPARERVVAEGRRLFPGTLTDHW